jgi:hypothetical protein
MEFAGKEYIYLSKLKKDKIKNLQQAEKENAEDAPVIKEEEEEEEKEEKKEKKMEVEEEDKKEEKNKEEEDEKDDNISLKLKKYGKSNKKDVFRNIELAVSDDGNLSVNSAEFDMDMERDSNDSENEEPAPMNQNKKEGRVYKKEIDVNVCLIKYDGLQNEAENNVLRLYQCQQCKSYLNKYSNIIPENDKYNWKCEFCSHENKDLIINKVDIPLNDTIENCLAPGINKELKTPEKDDSSLVFCFDISGSMCQSYDVGKVLKNKFNKILGKKDNKNKFKFQNNNSDDEDNQFDYNMENTNYISRLDLVKCSIRDNINSLLKNAPNTKVGIVSFGSDIEVKGDCLSNVMMIKEKDMNNESKIKSLGEENTNLIKAPISESHENIIKALNATEENGSTALGPAVLMSLSLLKNAKIGSRIFLCTDGMSNLGVGNISENKDNAKDFYTKIGEMAKEKGIIINLITFQDSESEIDILMSMVDKSGGEIIRVNPNAILDGFNDLLENEAIASEVELRMNLNKCLTFRDQEEKDLSNDGSTIYQKLGNVAKETETYYEIKFKKAMKLAEMKDINFEELKNLIFQIEITYRNKIGGKYVRVITKNMKVSDNKEEVEKQANYDIITACEIQKSAKLAGQGLYREAQAQAHVARKYLKKNKKVSYESYQVFNNNMNEFNQNLDYNYKNNMDKDLSDDEELKEEKKECKKKCKSKKMKTHEEFNSKDLMSEQIFSLSRTSQNRQKMNFKRNKKK